MSSAECLLHGAVHASNRAPPRPAVDVVVGAHGAAPSAAANPAGTSGSSGEANGVAHAVGGVPRPQRAVVAATTWLAATASTGLCALDGASSDDDLTPRIDAQAAGQDLGSSSAISCMPVSAVQEDAGAGLDERDLDDDAYTDVISVLFDGVPAHDDNNDADLVSLGASLGVSSVAALPPPSHTPPSSPGS